MKNKFLYLYLFVMPLYSLNENDTLLAQVSFNLINNFIEIFYKTYTFIENEKILVLNINKYNFEKHIKAPHQEILLQAEVKGDLNVSGSIYSAQGINSGGVLNALYGIKITSGGANIIGNLNVNVLDAYTTNIGNISNGKNISLLTSSTQSVSIKTGAVVLKSQSIGIPSNGANLPLTIDSLGVIRTLYSTKKMKEHIEYFNIDSKTLDQSLKDLKPCSFDYTKESGLSGAKQWGIILEDLESNNLLKNIIIYNNLDNSLLTTDDKKITTLLILYAKNQMEKIEKLEKDLQNKIDAYKILEERIEKLEKKIVK